MTESQISVDALVALAELADLELSYDRLQELTPALYRP